LKLIYGNRREGFVNVLIIDSKMRDKLTIAIDGYSSSGKSTVAKDLAARLGYTYIDSGAMYRVVTLVAMRKGIIQSEIVDEVKLNNELEQIDISFSYNSESKRYESYLNGELVEDEIRSLDVSNKVSHIAKIPFVREFLVEKQREMGDVGGVIMDGRDIGTVVFPNADIKLFVTADVEVRARRRYNELIAKGEDVSLQDVIDNVRNRDHIDETREVSPLRKADDAVVLDTSKMTPADQLEWLENMVKEKLAV
jgi:cytidylate kinase